MMIPSFKVKHNLRWLYWIDNFQIILKILHYICKLFIIIKLMKLITLSSDIKAIFRDKHLMGSFWVSHSQQYHVIIFSKLLVSTFVFYSKTTFVLTLTLLWSMLEILSWRITVNMFCKCVSVEIAYITLKSYPNVMFLSLSIYFVNINYINYFLNIFICDCFIIITVPLATKSDLCEFYFLEFVLNFL